MKSYYVEPHDITPAKDVPRVYVENTFGAFVRGTESEAQQVQVWMKEHPGKTPDVNEIIGRQQ